MFEKGKCPQCGNYNNLVFSNNPLVSPICFQCVHKQMDFKNLEHADYFCRTYNIPFNPTRWIKILEKDPKNIIRHYTQAFLDENKDNLFYTTSTKDLWREANEEWEQAMTHAELIKRIQPIKNSFIARGIIKWGNGYSFMPH